MKENLYCISPRIVPTGKKAVITVKGKFPHSDLRTFQGEFIVDSVRFFPLGSLIVFMFTSCHAL